MTWNWFTVPRMSRDDDIEDDPALGDVITYFETFPDVQNDGIDLEQVFARSVRKAIDEVIDGARTGRFRYDQLEAQEKTYIGTRIEIVVMTDLGLSPGNKLDTVVAGHDVDIKWSAKGSWMIPQEAIGEICLVLAGDESGGSFSVGVVRCRPEWLREGLNRDRKTGLSKEGKKHVHWLVKDGALPTNFLASLDEETRKTILDQPAGQARVREFFMRVPGIPVPREVIPTLAVQVDPMRRVRQDGDKGRLGGMKILSGHYSASRKAAAALGYKLTKRDYVSVPIEELLELPEETRRSIGLD
jgi:hypothetical protein